MKIAILYGGKSAEHNVSVRSAINAYHLINSLHHTPILIGIEKSGKAYLQQGYDFENNPHDINLANPIYFSLGNGIHTAKGIHIEIDCAFPITHGTYGEDGCIQGVLELSQIPYIGENVATSAICMDKHLTKLILQQQNINVTPYIIYSTENSHNYEKCSKSLGKKLIIKPASSGSSFGVSLVEDQDEFDNAIKLAKTFSKKIIIEKYIEGREINCAILGKPKLIGSLGEITNITSPFYSYEEKYIIKSNELQIPAKLENHLVEEIQSLSLSCFDALQCRSFVRFDIFIDSSEKLYVNEVNTIPAFSEKSIYPKLMEAIGVSQKELLSHLINLALH